jgi:predicted GTPase
VLTPLLHRSTIRFFGMQEPKNYVAYKVKNDKMFTLTHDKLLQVWNIISGKLDASHQLSGQDYSQYDVYSHYKDGKVVLVSKNDIEDVNENEFFQDW